MLSAFPQTEITGGRATSMAFSPDGRLLALGGSDGSVRILDAETGRELHRTGGGGGAVVGVGFQPSGSRYFAAWEDRRIALVDLISGDAVAEFRTGEA
ncbi:MAG: hypothetical protein FIA95_10610, partial [Gemmatimonadetes bacterium]|nr:hypothetical protein [Gemmatimonadota bacterium]